MARTATAKIRFTPTSYANTYAVERRQGQVTVCLGRVSRFGNTWAALGLGLPAWTQYRRTRWEAVADMLAAQLHG